MPTMWISVGTSILQEPGLKNTIMSELGSDEQTEWLMDIEAGKDIRLPPKLESEIGKRAKAYKSTDVISALGPELFSLLKSKYSSEINKVVFIVSKNKQNLISYILIKTILEKIIRNEKLLLNIEPPIIIDDIDTTTDTNKFITGLKNLWEKLDADSNLNYGQKNVLSIIGGLKATTTLFFQWAMQNSSTNKILYAFSEWEKPIEIELPKIVINSVHNKNTSNDASNLIVTIGTQMLKGIKKFLEEQTNIALLEAQLNNSNVFPILENLLDYLLEKTDTINSDNWLTLCNSLLTQGDNSELFGPEIRGILWFIENKKINKIILMHTGTESNKRIAELVKRFAVSHNQNVDLVEFSEQIGKADSVQEGINSLLSICINTIHNGDYVFSLGGYKHAVAIVTTYALTVGATAYYMHRDWESPKEVYPYKFSFSKEWVFEILKKVENINNKKLKDVLEKILWTGNGYTLEPQNYFYRDLAPYIKNLFYYNKDNNSLALSGLGKIFNMTLTSLFDDFLGSYDIAYKFLREVNIPHRKTKNVEITGGIHENEYKDKVKCAKLFLSNSFMPVSELWGSKKDIKYNDIDLLPGNINKLVIISIDNVTQMLDLQIYCHIPYKGEYIRRFNHIRFADNKNSLIRMICFGILLKNKLIDDLKLLLAD